MNIYYVYALSDPENEWPFYIGKGYGDRAKRHLGLTTRGVNKYKDAEIDRIRLAGREPTITFIFENLLEDEALKEEEKLIEHIGRAIVGEGPLVNLMPGGIGFTGKHSEETKLKISISKRGQLPWITGRTHSLAIRAKLRESHLGKIGPWAGKQRSEVTKERIRATLTGRTQSEEHKQLQRMLYEARKDSDQEAERRRKISEAGKRRWAKVRALSSPEI